MSGTRNLVDYPGLVRSWILGETLLWPCFQTKIFFYLFVCLKSVNFIDSSGISHYPPQPHSFPSHSISTLHPCSAPVKENLKRNSKNKKNTNKIINLKISEKFKKTSKNVCSVFVPGFLIFYLFLSKIILNCILKLFLIPTSMYSSAPNPRDLSLQQMNTKYRKI